MHLKQRAVRSFTARRLTNASRVEFCLQQSGPVLPRNEMRIEFWDFDERRILLVWRPILLREGQIESECELQSRLLTDPQRVHLSKKVTERRADERQHFCYCNGWILRKENRGDVELVEFD